MSNATLSFLPWVRQGAASAIKTPDSLGAAQSALATVGPSLTLNGGAVAAPAVRLRGPADVVGLDSNQVIRTDPRPGTTDFEPNDFPSIEFDRADFPWLFTPAAPNASKQLRPWLCLVVVRRQTGVSIVSGSDAPVTTLQLDAPVDPRAELPDLGDAWAWAHAQVAATDTTEPEVRRALNGASELSLSRLVCPRVLAPHTDYVACVVPTFDVGRRAGLGIAVSDAELTAANALAPAWPASGTIALPFRLPVYYHWEFRTGEEGDFESLARSLTPTVPTGLGRRTIDISQPGFPASGATTAELEGALLPIPPAGSSAPNDPIPAGFKQTLASIVSDSPPSQTLPPNVDPPLAPPMYGRWHAAKTAADPAKASWFEQLNLDPRWRVAAAFGTRVVQEHQEALMASAWEQAAELPAANQRRRQLQLSLAVSGALHRRHFATLAEETMLRLAAPAFGRVRATANSSLLAVQDGTRLPLDANRTAMRRIGRIRGPLTRRVAAKGGLQRTPGDSWVARINGLPKQQIPVVARPVAPAMDFATLPLLIAPIALVGSARSNFGAFPIVAERAPVVAPGAPVPDTTRTELPDRFRAAAKTHLAVVFAPRSNPITSHTQTFQTVKDLVLAVMRPDAALTALAGAVAPAGSRVLHREPAGAAGATPIALGALLAPPHFPQPMYEPLRDISPALLLPGLDRVGPNTVCGLQTNRRFVDAYMVGLNHEFGRELLWRGYPTDQRATFFDQFWGLATSDGTPVGAPVDVTAIDAWGGRALGASDSPSSLTERFVLLMRSSLLRRYPNASIYLAPAVAGGGPDERAASEEQPLFTGSLPPDVTFFGFRVTTDQALGKPSGLGYYVVIQEHPTEPRFGIDAGTAPPNATHVPAAGRGATAAAVAAATRRQPVRVAIHASRLIR